MNPNDTIKVGDYVTVAPVLRGATYDLPRGSYNGTSEESAQTHVEDAGASGWKVTTGDELGCECCRPEGITDDDGDVKLEKYGRVMYVLPDFLTLDSAATVDEAEAIRPTPVDPAEFLRVIGLSVALGVIGARAAGADREGDAKAARELEALGARFAQQLDSVLTPRGVTADAVSNLLRTLATEGPLSLLDS